MNKSWVAMVVLSCLPSVLHAGTEESSWMGFDNKRGHQRLDYHECRLLVQEGRILSLSELMRKAEANVIGRVLDAALIRDAGLYFYEMEVVGDDGIVRIVQLDAKTGEKFSEMESGK